MLEYIAEKCDGNKAEFARRVKRSPTYINRLASSPDDKNHKNLDEGLAREFDKLLDTPELFEVRNYSVDGGKPVKIEARPIVAYDSIDELPKESTVFIPRGGIELSAGNGRKHWEVVELEPLPFQAESLKHIKAKPKNMLAVKVTGASMEPLLFDGDTVIIDKSDRRVPTSGGVFAVVYGDELLVKRLFQLPTGIKVQSDNTAAGPTFDLKKDECDENLKVIGRVKYRSGFGNF